MFLDCTPVTDQMELVDHNLLHTTLFYITEICLCTLATDIMVALCST